MIHLQNEDSLLFWTEQDIKGKQLELLGQQFGDWRKAKYGSIAAAVSLGRRHGPGRCRSRGILGMLIVWQFTQQRDGGLKKRLDDQLQFFAETMYGFNAEIAALPPRGARLPATDQRRQLEDGRFYPAQRRGTMVVHGQRGAGGQPLLQPVHIGPDRGWRIDKGDQFEDVSVLLIPELPLNIKQVAGHPMMITETHWVPPLAYQSEGPSWRRPTSR